MPSSLVLQPSHALQDHLFSTSTYSLGSLGGLLYAGDDRALLDPLALKFLTNNHIYEGFTPGPVATNFSLSVTWH